MTVKACTGMVLNQFELSKNVLKSLSKFNLSPTGKLVLLALVDCYNPKKVDIFPKQETIADGLGISTSSVKRAIKELTDRQLIIYERKYQNRYQFTQVFFDSLKKTPKTVQVEPELQLKLNHACHEQKHEQKKNKVISFELTEFQKKYREIFEKLSESDLRSYKCLKGYEKEEWLKAKRRDLAIKKNSQDLQSKINTEKHNTASPLDFDRKTALRWLNSLPDFAKNGYFATELKKKWNLK